MRTVVLLAMNLMCCTTAASGSSDLPPRAWLVTRGQAAAVLVGESHFRTTQEFDRYYQRIVKPSFQAADVALLEAHFGPENDSDLGYNLAAPCKTDDGAPPSERVRRRFAQLIEATRSAGFEVPDWMQHWEVFPKNALTSLHLPTFVARTIGPVLAATKSELTDNSGVGQQLAADAAAARLRRPLLKGLDTVAAVRARYCGATDEQREDVLITKVDSTIGMLRVLLDAKAGQSVNIGPDVARAWLGTLNCIASDSPCRFPVQVGVLARYGLAVSDLPGNFKLSIPDRTLAWRPQIENAMREHRRIFVAVGVLHLADVSYRGHVYPGLLTLLRRDGFSVVPIRDEGDLPEKLLRRRWWEDVFSF
ncbi:MAG: TraB/GumN family protein [Pseudomonadota bacterium]